MRNGSSSTNEAKASCRRSAAGRWSSTNQHANLAPTLQSPTWLCGAVLPGRWSQQTQSPAISVQELYATSLSLTEGECFDIVCGSGAREAHCGMDRATMEWCVGSCARFDVLSVKHIRCHVIDWKPRCHSVIGSIMSVALARWASRIPWSDNIRSTYPTLPPGRAPT